MLSVGKKSIRFSHGNKRIPPPFHLLSCSVSVKEKTVIIMVWHWRMGIVIMQHILSIPGNAVRYFTWISPDVFRNVKALARDADPSVKVKKLCQWLAEIAQPVVMSDFLPHLASGGIIRGGLHHTKVSILLILPLAVSLRFSRSTDLLCIHHVAMEIRRDYRVVPIKTCRLDKGKNSPVNVSTYITQSSQKCLWNVLLDQYSIQFITKFFNCKATNSSLLCMWES